MDYVKEAKALGFTQAALMPVSELVIVPEYRMFCEENLCGNYNVLPACPPASGTVEEMTARRQNHAFDASAAEAAGHQDAVYLLHCISERVLRQVF